MAEYDDMMDGMRRNAQTQETCPPATGNIQLNMENRQKAIKEANYGPANPALDDTGGNQEFWETYATLFKSQILNKPSKAASLATAMPLTSSAHPCECASLGPESRIKHELDDERCPL